MKSVNSVKRRVSFQVEFQNLPYILALRICIHRSIQKKILKARILLFIVYQYYPTSCLAYGKNLICTMQTKKVIDIIDVTCSITGLIKFGLPQWLSSKETTCNLGVAEDTGHGNPLQDSCLENPMDRGAWRARVHRVAKCQTQLNTQACIIKVGLPWWPRGKEPACQCMHI